MLLCTVHYAGTYAMYILFLICGKFSTSPNKTSFHEKKYSTKAIRKLKNVCAYNPRNCFIVPDQSFGVFSRV